MPLAGAACDRGVRPPGAPLGDLLLMPGFLPAAASPHTGAADGPPATLSMQPRPRLRAGAGVLMAEYFFKKNPACLQALIPPTLPAWLPVGVHVETRVLIGPQCLRAGSHLASCGEGLASVPLPSPCPQPELCLTPGSCAGAGGCVGTECQNGQNVVAGCHERQAPGMPGPGPA